MAASTSTRFASLEEEEYEQLLQNKDTFNTKKSTKTSVTVFREYLAEKGHDSDFQLLGKSELAALLAKFYVEVRRTDGTHYKTSSLHSIRAGINRYLKSEYHEVIDIIKDIEFTHCNVAFKAAKVELKKIGKGFVQHHDSIASGDLQKLYSSTVFDQDTPSGLQAKVWFEIALYFCRRGRENLRELNKDHFKIETDENGHEFVTQNVDEMTKKTREDNLSSRTDGGRMYSTGRADCPVASFKKYHSKLSERGDALFQTPKTFTPSCGPWYKKTPLGKNSLGNKMSTISKKAGLSKVYTNHCVRATCIRILDTGGFASRDICQVSGHNNEGSLASYTGRVSNDRKCEMSSTLAQALGKKETPLRAAITVPPPPATVNMASSSNATNTRFAVAAPHAVPTLLLEVEEEDDLEVNFDLCSQLSFEFEREETNVIQHEVAVPAPVNAVLQPVVDNQQVAAGSTITTSSRSSRMQVQQSPFVFNNCNVTINYFKD
eukprot:XP_011673464.1 PREDICTED: uncharacterized protein KIAA1958-like [Strongylocentrotus purpuratus]